MKKTEKTLKNSHKIAKVVQKVAKLGAIVKGFALFWLV